MGMLGSLYVRPRQNRTGVVGNPAVPRARLAGNNSASAPLGYAYNDGDGSTRYEVEYAIQMAGFDPDFHTADLTFQSLPFSAMKDRYFLLNGAQLSRDHRFELDLSRNRGRQSSGAQVATHSQFDHASHRASASVHDRVPALRRYCFPF